MAKRWLVCAVVGCSSPSPVAPPAASPPVDHALHVTSTPEPGGTHLEITGTAVAVQDLKLPSFVPLTGALDLHVDLHVPGGDYRRATGEATGHDI